MSTSPPSSPKPIPFAINGLGRIGRCLVRVARDRDDLELVAVNDVAPTEGLARLVARDSVHGPFAGEVAVEGDDLVVDGRRVHTFHRSEPGQIPWRETPATVVVEATGRFSARADAAGHLRQGGPERVVISAIAPDADGMLCVGVNLDRFDPRRHVVVSNASCTTYCLALLAKVLHDAFGIEHALMNEVHSYTGNQLLVDGHHPDPRRGRAAASNIVPTTTAAPTAVGELLPELSGRLVGQAVRVPTPNVALLDLVAHLGRPATADAVRNAFRAAAGGPFADLLAVSDEPLVSSDHVGDPHSAIVDLPLVHMAGDRLCRISAWYDNEWGYAHRLADLLASIGDPPR
ncbi:MAG: type I glyceraldehyde-3-phosphate dehydrogenase [Acidobacteriota bacterium]